MGCGTALLESSCREGAGTSTALEGTKQESLCTRPGETEIWTKLLNPVPHISAGVTWFNKLKCQCCDSNTSFSFLCFLYNDTQGVLQTYTEKKKKKDREKHTLNCMQF